MYRKKFVVCSAAALLAVAVACSKSSQSPVTPTAATPDSSTGAAADGSTLKSSTPTAVSPTGGAQPPDPVTLTSSKSTTKFTASAVSYQFQVRSGSTVVYDSGVVSGTDNGSNVSQAVPTSALAPETDYTWRVRSTLQGAVGPWSADASFKSPVGAYLRTGELRDPLSIGRTVGTPVGNVTFSSEGATLNDAASRIQYVIGEAVTTGEFSMMVKNIKSAAPGDKSKIMAIQEGFGDITTNDYRFTIEKRGSGYPEPGATTFRIITGDSASRIFDGQRATVNYDTNHWYLWTARWRTGQASLTVVDTDTGRTVYNVSAGTGTHEYRPSPMVAYVGSPVGRAGDQDASVPRIIVKDVWLSASPRPTFPTTVK
ncbi:MAG: hypothetical protein ABJC89_12115 [Acidobacteriota bacterium]